MFNDEGMLPENDGLEESQEFGEEESGEAGDGAEYDESGELEETEETGDQDEGDAGLFAGRYKTYGGLAQAYVKQREQLSLPVDLQNYGTPEKLEKAFLRDQKRLETGYVPDAQHRKPRVEVDEMSEAQLFMELQRQQGEVQNMLGGGQPGQPPLQPQFAPQQTPQQFLQQPVPEQQPPPGYVPQGQPIQLPAARKHSVFDEYRGNPEDFAEKLLSDPISVLRDVIREEIDIQGTQLGYVLQNVLTPMAQNVAQVRSQVDIDREVRSLERKLIRSGESLDDYWPEMQQVLQRYPGLRNVPKGLDQALEMAKVQKAIGNRTAKKNPAKSGLRVGAAKGSGVPRAQYTAPGKLSPIEAEKRAIFGSGKDKGVFDD
jgi:hypothetical protein